MIQGRAIVTVEDEKEVVHGLSNGAFSNDLECDLTQISRSSSNNSKVAQDTAMLTMAYQ